MKYLIAFPILAAIAALVYFLIDLILHP